MFALPSSTSPVPLRAMPSVGGARLAVNYSAAAAELVRAGVVDVDLFKCPDWEPVLEAAQRQRPVYVHFPLAAGRCTGDVAGLDAITECLRLTGTPFVNTSLDPQIVPQSGMMGSLFEAIQRALQDVRTLAACFGTDRIVVENVPHAHDDAMHAALAAEPTFIRQVVEETGCGLLLNLAHARRAARSLAMDARLYLSLLPVKSLRALHVTGVPGPNDQTRSPMPMTDTDWDLFNWVMDQIHNGAWPAPRVIALDYGGAGPWFEARMDAAVLAHQIGCMQQTVEHLTGRAAFPIS